MHKLLPMLSLLVLSTAAHAQRFLAEVFPSSSKTPDITYGSNFSVLTGAPVSQDLKLDIYQPAGATDTMQKRPLIIFLHSGSFLPAYRNGQFDGGRNDSGIVFMCESFAKRGYVVANVDYRTGWNPAGSTIDIRRGTLINAFVRGIQDVRAAVRFMRKDAATTNTYKIDPDRVIVGGTATGGALAVNFAALVDTNQLKIPKFQGSNGAYYVSHSAIGDLDGFGGNPALNNSGNSPGYSGRANFIFAFEAIVGDSSWIIPGLPPIVSVHRQNNPNNTQPYGNGTVSVNVGGGSQQVVDVSGSGVFIPLHNADGNNACFNPNNFTDPITVKAMQLSGGVEGLYPVQSNTAAVTWYDSTASVTECIAAGGPPGAPTPTIGCNAVWASYAAINNKAQNLLYIDTFMRYVNPRIVRCLNLDGTTSVRDASDAVRGFEVAPNPSRGLLTVRTTGTAPAITEVCVRDLAGREVHRANVGGKHSTTVSLEGVAPGIYLLSITAGSETATQRLVIQQ